MVDLVEETVEVDVYAVAAGRVEQDVLAVPVAQPQDVARHAHDGRRATVRHARVVPRRRVGERSQEPLVEDRRMLRQQLLSVDFKLSPKTKYQH